MKSWSDMLADNDFWSRLSNAPAKALILDYDGTLAPFVVDREKAFPYPGVRELLAEIMDGVTRVVFVTGRSTDMLVRLVDLKKQSEVFGSHGAERLHPDGRLEPLTLTPEQEAALDRAFSLLGEVPAEQLEEKPGCRAFHLRGLDRQTAEKLEVEVRRAWSALAEEAGLSLNVFNGGLELRVPGHDKGAAVRTILAEEGEGVFACYLGDDLTDEDAFKALKEHGAGADVHCVLVREEPRETLADWRLAPPDELLAFLGRWRDACAA